MKITVNENFNNDEIEIIINCRHVDEQILRIVTGLRAADNKIPGMLNDQTYLLDTADILYIESIDRKTFLYTGGHVYETSQKLYELEERLSGNDFIRATKSCILNFGKVKTLRGDFGGRLLCTLENGEAITVSRQYAVIIKQKLDVMKGDTIK